jgi:two-component system, OmpR family, sensor kinase
MTLRARLVAALVVLVVAGLAVFGYATYRLYAEAQFDELDGQLEAAAPLVGDQLRQEPTRQFPVPRPTSPRAGQDGGDDGEVVVGGAPWLPDVEPGRGAVVVDGDEHRTTDGPVDLDDPEDLDGSIRVDPGPQRQVPPAFFRIYGELREDGEVVRTAGNPEDRPDLVDEPTSDDVGRYFTAGSVGGSTQWRVLVTDTELGEGQLLVVAVPTTDVRDALSELVLIEAVAALVLLSILGVGAWLILRRGLRPLERMATTAHGITVGDLGQRVAPADDRSEIGNLGLALNTMLGRLEDAFAEQERTEARLRQFLADAAHELRTPLTSIQGFAELFRLGADQDPEAVAVSLRRIEEESGRMRTLVDDLLLLARLDRTRPVERVPVDLAVLAADACSDAAAAAPARRITLDAPEPVVVPGDRDHLRQAVGNLVANAVRHTPTGTPIEVRVHRAGGGRGVGAGGDDDGRRAGGGDDGDGAAGDGVVVVRDHGPGLDEEAVAHAFDRFWQADPSRSDAGAGLGLSIVAGIAAEHGGTVSVANVDEAQDDEDQAGDGGSSSGAVFTLTLPAQVDEPAGDAGAPDPDPAGALDAGDPDDPDPDAETRAVEHADPDVLGEPSATHRTH